MHVIRKATDYNFYGNKITGLTLRWGHSSNDNPRMAPWPELVDISISNRCHRNCSYCYRASVPDGNIMSIDDFTYLLDALQHPVWGSVFQIAIGGGEPLEHPSLFAMLDAAIVRQIVPNLTTNGELLTPAICAELQKRIGAIALSTIDLRVLDHGKLMLLLSSGIRTNIHFLLTMANLVQAREILSGAWDCHLRGINAIVFLTYKQRGRANDPSLTLTESETEKFISALKKKKSKIRVGFDSCFVPPLLRADAVNPSFVDCCECGFFSVYVDEDLNVSPCSFFSSREYTFSLRDKSFSSIWENEFSKFRKKAEIPCQRNCLAISECTTHCVYYKGIPLCYREGKATL